MECGDTGGRLRSRAYWATWAASLLFFAAFYALLVPLPLYLAHVGLRDWEIGAVLGVFGIASLAARLPAGLLADVWGRRPVMLLGVAALITGSVSLSVASSGLSLAGLRALQAIGYVFFTTASTAQVSDLTPPERHGGALALFGIAANAAMTLTPAAVGAALPVLTLKGTFWLAGVLAVLSGVVTVLARAPRESGKRAPVARSSVRLVTTLRVATLAAGLFGVGFGAFLQFLPLLAERRGLGTAGLAYTTYGVVIVITRLVVRRSLDEGNRTRDVFAGFLALALALGGFAAAHSHALMLLAAGGLAVGSGILHPALIAAHLERVPVVERGRAAATFYLGFDLGIGLGAWVLSPAIYRFGLTGLYLWAAAAAAMGTALARSVASDRRGLVQTAMTE